MIRRAAVIGLGTMGPGIAMRLARGGLEVRGYDRDAAQGERTDAIRPIIGEALDALGIEGREGSFTVAHTLEDAVADADLVIENIPESVEAKAELYRAIDPLIGTDTLVATNTSAIPITRLQAHISNPARMAGMHWSNPPHIVPIIEVIAGRDTAPQTVGTIRALIRRIGLLPVTIRRDAPGFVENRVLYALLREVIDLVEAGAITAEDIDTCVSWGIGFKLAVIGPMALLDVAGLDIYRSVASHLNAELCDRKDVAPMILEKTEAGRLGLKSGGGIYDYNLRQIKELYAQRSRKLVAIRRVMEREI
ncbi:MAG: 3-hydroxyacyl-CoA dehydrogenase family protein [Alphaproteobacteria bacterium]|nr:MAG: 3-hydroxyacyl-CoA dehydrogenase family protein [Alphaproteobacteria bacterium]